MKDDDGIILLLLISGKAFHVICLSLMVNEPGFSSGLLGQEVVRIMGRGRGVCRISSYEHCDAFLTVVPPPIVIILSD